MNNQNPFAMLLRSRKFLLAMLDAVISTVMLVATRYASPADLDFVKQIVLIYQPVIIVLIGSIAYEDKARLENPPVTTTTASGIAPNVTITQTKETPATVAKE